MPTLAPPPLRLPGADRLDGERHPKVVGEGVATRQRHTVLRLDPAHHQAGDPEDAEALEAALRPLRALQVRRRAPRPHLLSLVACCALLCLLTGAGTNLLL